MKKIILFAIIASSLFVACKSGYKAYKKGDYYKGAIDAIHLLKKSPSSEKARYVLSKTYPLAISTAQRNISIAKQSTSPTNYEEVVLQYQNINDLADNIYRCPAALEIIPKPEEFHTELSEAKEMAASQCYDLGLKNLETGTLEGGRSAFNLFLRTNNYVNGYRNVIQLLDEARYQGTLRVMFEKPITNSRFQYSADFFSSSLYTDLGIYAEKKLVRLFNYENGTNTGKVNPHQYLVLNFEDFTVGNVFESKNTVEISRDSVITGTVTIEGKKVNVYGTVKAKLTTFRREIKSGGILSVRIFDNQNRLIQQRNFSGEYTWYTVWGQYNGDSRALTKEQLRQCNGEPALPPAPQDLFIEFTKPIYSQTLSYLKQYYNKY